VGALTQNNAYDIALLVFLNAYSYAKAGLLTALFAMSLNKKSF